jgi:hypothetical protein
VLKLLNVQDGKALIYFPAFKGNVLAFSLIKLKRAERQNFELTCKVFEILFGSHRHRSQDPEIIADLTVQNFDGEIALHLAGHEG